jgi:hypothetical protein
VWRLRQPSSREVLRLGRVAVERWQEVPGGLVCVATRPLAADAVDRFEELPSAIEALFGASKGAHVTVVVESAWLPVMRVETGPAVWRRAEVEALLRHRLGLLYDEPSDPVREWDMRIDHRAGESWALGYGFSPRLREALAEAARLTGHEWASLSPAWAWGWQRMRPQRHWAGKTGHWAMHEQDRMLLGSFEAGRLIALNAAATVCDSSESLMQELVSHGARSGLAPVEWPCAATTWRAAGDLPVNTGRVMWQGLAASSTSASIAKVAA